MKGSEKQIKWAESIKQQRKEDIKNLNFRKNDGSKKQKQQRNLFLKAVKVLLGQEISAEWINSRHEETLQLVRNFAQNIRADDM